MKVMREFYLGVYKKVRHPLMLRIENKNKKQ